jgi:hypothetical protein
MLVVAIIMAVETTQRRHASQRHALRPSLAAMKPAVAELMNAPRVISDEMSCWRSGWMFQPEGDFGDLNPKT